MKRLFLALSVEHELAQRLARVASQFERECGPLAPHEAEDLHLTLSFLGEIADEDVAGVVSSANEELRGLRAPELELTGSLDLLPSRTPDPRALAALVQETDGGARLSALRNRAQQVGLSRRCPGHRADRRREFRPHVTLARLLGAPPAPFEGLDSGLERAWTGSEVVLFQSIPGRVEGGRRYEALTSWHLAVDPG
jgi:2'-5' RNA ligase